MKIKFHAVGCAFYLFNFQNFYSSPVQSYEGGTGLMAVPCCHVLVTNGNHAYTTLAPHETIGVPLVSQGSATNPAYTTASVAGGGTGVTSFTEHGVLIGEGSASIVATAAGTTNTVLLGNSGADPSFGQVPNVALENSTVTLNNGNNILISGSPVSLGGSASIALSGTTSHCVQVGNVTGSLTSLAAGSSGQVLVGATDADPAFVTPSAGTGLSLISNATTLQYALQTPVMVASGGTGVTSLTAYALIAGGITSSNPVQSLSGIGNIGDILVSNGAVALPTWQTPAIQTVSVTLTNSQVRNLGNSSVTLINAPGIGKVIAIEHACVKLNVGATATAFSGSGNLQIGYGRAPTVSPSNQDIITNAMVNASLGATTNQLARTFATANTGAAYSLSSNMAIVLYKSTAAVLGGNAANDNTITVSLTYQILTI